MKPVFEWVHQVADLNVVVDPDCDSLAEMLINPKGANITVGECFDMVTRQAGVKYRLQDGVVYVFREAPRFTGGPAPAIPDASEFESYLRAKLAERLSGMHLRNGTIKDLVVFLRIASGLDIGLDPRIDTSRTVTIEAADLSLQQTLNLVCQVCHLDYELGKDLDIHIFPAKVAAPQPASAPASPPAKD